MTTRLYAHALVRAFGAAGLEARIVGTGGNCEAVEVRAAGGGDAHALVTDGNAMTPWFDYLTVDGDQPGVGDIVACTYTDEDDEGSLVLDLHDVHAGPEAYGVIVSTVAAALGVTL